MAAGLELLAAEKELTRRSDDLAKLRQTLPWVPIDKEYQFDTGAGSASLAELFGGRSQLLIYHFMFGPDFTAGCPSCSAIADGFNSSVAHLAAHDVSFFAVSRAPLGKLQAGWSFPWASSGEGDFNHDFQASHTSEGLRSGALVDNFSTVDMRPTLKLDDDNPWVVQIARASGVGWATYLEEAPGMSAFALQNGVVHHTYSTYRRGVDPLWGMYAWLDRSPLGRNESGPWWRRHDEYETAR